MDTKTAPRSINYNRGAKAARIAARLERMDVADARLVTADLIRDISGQIGAPSTATIAAVTAILDVLRGVHDASVTGSAEQAIAYNVTRQAALLAEVLFVAGVDDPSAVNAAQWEMAREIVALSTGRQISESEAVRDMAEGVLAGHVASALNAES